MRSRSGSRRSQHILVGAGAAETACSEPESEPEPSKTLLGSGSAVKNSAPALKSSGGATIKATKALPNQK